MDDIHLKISGIDEEILSEGMNQQGYVLLPEFLPIKYCKELINQYDDTALYRKTITMEKYRFGSGEYKYFKYPLPKLIQIIRSNVYAKLAPIANNWMRLLNIKKQYPNEFEKLEQLCHNNNQKECTVLILKYGKGGFNTLHQDLYGNIFFPIQLVIFLSQPDQDYTGGEFVLIQQNPRAQSKAIVLIPHQGDMLIFTTNFRPAKGNKGYYQVQMRHGISEIHEGHRHTLGIIFHDALH